MDAAHGATYVAWVQTDDSASDVYVARLGPGGEREGAPVRVNSTPGDASTHEQAPPQVVTGPNGEVYVVWQKSREVEGRRFPATDLRFARSIDGAKSFESTIFVNDDAGGRPASHTFHDVAVAKDRSAIVVSWLDSRERERVQAEHALATPAAGEPKTGSPMAATAAMRTGLARSCAWRVRPMAAGASARAWWWTRTSAPCCRTALALAPDGGVYLVWRKVFPGSVRDVAIAHSADGGQSFSAPERVHADGWVFAGCPHAGPSVAVDATGRVHVAWYTGREGRQGLWYASRADGGRFGEPVALATGEWVPPSQVNFCPPRAMRCGRRGMIVARSRRECTSRASPALARRSRWASRWPGACRRWCPARSPGRTGAVRVRVR